MESKEIRGFLLILIFSHLCVIVISSSPLHQKTLSSDFQGERLGNSIDIKNGENGMKHRGGFHHRIGYKSGGGVGSRHSNSGYRGGGGGSTTPSNQGGGSNFVPVYAAGAGSNRHPNHRGDANRNRIGAPALICVTLASFIQVYVIYKLG